MRATSRQFAASPSRPTPGESSRRARINRFGCGTLERAVELINYDAVSGTVYGIAVSPDGRRLAAGLADVKILLWDLAAGVLLHTFELKTGGCLGLTFTTDGRELIAGMGDGSIWIGGLPEKILGESDPPARSKPPAKTKRRGRG